LECVGWNRAEVVRCASDKENARCGLTEWEDGICYQSDSGNANQKLKVPHSEGFRCIVGTSSSGDRIEHSEVFKDDMAV